MYRHILIPVALDHEALVDRKLQTGRHMLTEGGKITLLTVLENVPGFVSEFVTVKSDNDVSQEIRERLEAIVDGAVGISRELASGKPGVEIARFATNNSVDLIIVGSHQPGIEDYFLGSTAARVARRSLCSVLI